MRLWVCLFALVCVFALVTNAVETLNGHGYSAFRSDVMQLIGFTSMVAGYVLLAKSTVMSASTTRMFRICAWVAAFNAGLHGYILLAHWWHGT